MPGGLARARRREPARWAAAGTASRPGREPRRRRCAWPASGCGPPASRRRRSVARRRRLAALLGAGVVVLGHVALELGVGRGERVLAALAGLDDVEQVAG